MEEMNCVQHFFDAAKNYPDHQAIIAEGKTISYAELKREVIATVRYFESKGIRSGDRVLVFVPMSVDLYRIVLALFSMGATAVFLDEWVSKKRMEMCCEIADCAGFIGITKAHVLRFFSKELRDIPITLKIRHKIKVDNEFELFSPKIDHTALITFTTGSTGTPKAANRTHAFLIAQFEAIKHKLKPQPTDVVMPVLPIVLFINLGVGSTSVIYRYKSKKLSSINPKAVFDLMNKYKVNQVISSPSFITSLSNYVMKIGNYPIILSSIYTGGAPVFPKEAKLFAQAFPKAHIEVIYGSTEAEPISAVPVQELIASEGKQKGLLVGFPDSSAEVKIIPFRDEVIELGINDELELCPQGEIGEIIVAGNHVLTAYFNNPEALRRAKIWHGLKMYHRTGDSGYFDERRQLFLVGRSTQTIEVEGKIIYPFIFEDELQRTQHIRRGTILMRSEQVFVIVELDKQAAKEEVEITLRTYLQFTFRIIFSEIPLDRRHHGKIDHEALIKKLGWE